MKKEVKELLKEAYNSNEVCSKWKNKIKAVYPKVDKNALEVGKWYRDWVGGIAYYQGLNIETYGINSRGEWCLSDYWFQTIEGCVLSTEEEVKQALIKEAKKRGFKKGVEVKSIHSKQLFTINNNSFEYNNKSFPNELSARVSNGYQVVLFKRGEWSTIVETITKEEAEKQLGKTII